MHRTSHPLAFTMISRTLTQRRSILRTALALLAALICVDVSPALADGPGLKRITMATFTSADLAGVERDYSRWLGYQVRERGTISAELAKAWAAPGAQGKRYLLLSSEPSPDVFIRVIFGDYYSLEENEASSEVPLQSWDNPNDVTLAGCLDAKCRWCHFENYTCLSFIISYIGV